VDTCLRKARVPDARTLICDATTAFHRNCWPISSGASHLILIQYGRRASRPGDVAKAMGTLWLHCNAPRPERRGPVVVLGPWECITDKICQAVISSTQPLPWSPQLLQPAAHETLWLSGAIAAIPNICRREVSRRRRSPHLAETDSNHFPTTL
jgi:hypothetical protein